MHHGSGGEGQVEQHLHHVALLAVVVLVGVPIHDQVFATGNVYLDVVEEAAVGGVGQDVVPGKSADGALGRLPVVESGFDLWRHHAEAVVLAQIFVLMDNPVSVAEFDGLEEVGKVFVDGDLRLGKRVAPFGQCGVNGDPQDDDDGEPE